MFSGEGEEVPFTESLYPKGNVEDWLLTVEAVMRSSLKQIIKDSLDDYVEVSISVLSIRITLFMYLELQGYVRYYFFLSYYRSLVQSGC